MTSASGSSFNDFPEIVPTREITTKIVVFFSRVLDRGRWAYFLNGPNAAVSIVPTLIFIIYYATLAAPPTHTTAYNHIHQHTQNCIPRSIKTQKKTKNELQLKTSPYSIFHHTFTVLYCIQSVFGC